jgi:hypothetical protein
MSIRSRHSRRALAIYRSAMAFARASLSSVMRHCRSSQTNFKIACSIRPSRAYSRHRTLPAGTDDELWKSVKARAGQAGETAAAPVAVPAAGAARGMVSVKAVMSRASEAGCCSGIRWLQSGRVWVRARGSIADSRCTVSSTSSGLSGALSPPRTTSAGWVTRAAWAGPKAYSRTAGSSSAKKNPADSDSARAAPRPAGPSWLVSTAG